MEAIDLFEKKGIHRELTIEERDRKFRDDLWQLMGKTFDDFPYWMVVEFCDYWTEYNMNGRKMRFEKQKTFHPMRRLKQWKRNSQQMNPNKWPKEELKFKDFFSRSFMKSLTGDQRMLYIKHLENKGYKYFRSKHGGQSHILCPGGKREWL